MIEGNKIRFIRNFRNMSVVEFGKNLGLENPDVRISQYETGGRVPKEEMNSRIIDVLKVSQFALARTCDNQIIMCCQDFMWTETFINMLSKDVSNNYKFLYIERTQSCDLLSKIFNEIEQQQKLLWNQEITTKEYIEFKLQWPENSMYYEEIINYKK